MEFITELWSSILTPGTNPALIKATHASFAALLITLILLAIATRNIHYMILTVIATCLWLSITWFVSELEQEKARQKEQNQGTETTTATATSTEKTQLKQRS